MNKIKMQKLQNDKIDICFPGIATGCPYYLGIVTNLQEKFGNDLFIKNKKLQLSCVSGGAFVSAAFASGMNAEHIIDHYNEPMFMEVEKYSKKDKFKYLYKSVFHALQDIVPDVYAENYNDRVFIQLKCITFPRIYSTVVKSNWNTKNDFVIDVMRSGFLPYLTMDSEILSLLKIVDEKKFWFDGLKPPSTSHPRVLCDANLWNDKKTFKEIKWHTNIENFKDVFILGYEQAEKIETEYPFFRKSFA